ncbi:12040_t:CDS:1, partial [Gigaspora margarita]
DTDVKTKGVVAQGVVINMVPERAEDVTFKEAKNATPERAEGATSEGVANVIPKGEKTDITER